MGQSLGLFTSWLAKEGLEVSGVTYGDLLCYIDFCKRGGASQKTVSGYVNVLRHYYGYLLRLGEVESNPALDVKLAGVKRKQLYHLFDGQQLDGLYHSYRDASLKGQRNKVILGLLVYQGLKVEELGRLEVGDIQLMEGKVAVGKSLRANYRLMDLEGCQVLAMNDYIGRVRPGILEHSGEASERLLISLTGGSTVSNLLSSLLRPLRKQHPKLENAQQLRASVIVNWLKRYNLRQVQYLAGHRYVSATEAYLENDMEGLQAAVEKYHPF